MRFKLGRSKKNYLVIAAAVAVVGVGWVVTEALFLGGSGSPLSSSDIDLQRGLVGWWKLDGNGKDSTPYGNDGTLVNGPVPAADRKGKSNSAMSFNGVNQYLRMNSSGLPSSAITVSLWVNQTTLVNWYDLAANNWITEGGWDLLVAGNGQVVFGIYSGGTQYNAQCNSGAFSTNTWHHLVGTYDGTTVKVYLDGGVCPTTKSVSGVTLSTTGNWTVGEHNGGNGSTHSIDDVRVYNRALSANEVSALFNSYDSSLNLGSGEASLVGWWRLDGNAKDSTPYGNDGTVTGATPTTDREGRSNGAYSFNGTSDYIQVPDINLSANSFSATAWIKPNTAGDEKIIGTYNGSSGTSLLQIFTGGQLRVCITFCAVATDNLVDGNWHFAVVVGDGSSIRAYVDGNPTPVITHAAISYNINGTTYIGRDPQTGGYRFNGSIDDVRLYKRALSVSEITNLYNSYDSRVSLYSSAGSSGQSVNLSQGLVGQWNFSGNARDATPYGDDGTVSGPTLTVDRLGRANSAYAFNGSSQYITVQNNSIFKPASAVSVSTWVNPSLTSTAVQKILSATEGGSYNLEITGANADVSCNPNDLCFLVNIAGTYRAAQVSKNNLTIGSWQLVTGTYNGSSLDLYINGSLVNGFSISGGINENTAPLCFGSEATPSSCNGGGFFSGSLDGVRIYNRALSAAEVQALYNLTD